MARLFCSSALLDLIIHMSIYTSEEYLLKILLCKAIPQNNIYIHFNIYNIYNIDVCVQGGASNLIK